MRPCLLIPVYNHCDPLEAVIDKLADSGLPCLLIDDGSNERTKLKLLEIEHRHAWVRVETRRENGGKGACSFSELVQRGHYAAFRQV